MGFEEQLLFERAAEVANRDTALVHVETHREWIRAADAARRRAADRWHILVPVPLSRPAAVPIARPAPAPIARPAPAPPVERNVLARAAETRRVANYLRTAHECAHKSRLIQVTGTGPYTCEKCSHGNGDSIMRCHQYRTHLCDRCLRNRLR